MALGKLKSSLTVCFLGQWKLRASVLRDALLPGVPDEAILAVTSRGTVVGTSWSYSGFGACPLCTAAAYAGLVNFPRAALWGSSMADVRVAWISSSITQDDEHDGQEHIEEDKFHYRCRVGGARSTSYLEASACGGCFI